MKTIEEIRREVSYILSQINYEGGGVYGNKKAEDKILSLIEQDRKERNEALNEALEALALMYNQYCSESGHLYMSAGEHALSVLERFGLIDADIIGRGCVPYEKAHDPLSISTPNK